MVKPNLSRETKISGANEDPVELTTVHIFPVEVPIMQE